MLAFGVGLSALVGDIQYKGNEISYVRFIAPALIAINIMYNAFFENTYGSFVRMYYQKTFDAMMATPLSVEEIITGEIIWGATKSVIATAIMMAVISLFGLIRYPQGLLIIPLALLGGIAFGSVGMFITGITTHIELFNLPIFLFITPMFLFSGTFFRLKIFPCGPSILRTFTIDPSGKSNEILELRIAGGIHVVGARLFSRLLYHFFPLAVHRMHRRLIK